MKLIAHRGASLHCQENSIESLCYAARIGADAVECDIRRSGDGEYIVFHDNDLLCTAGKELGISQLNLSEIRCILSQSGYTLTTLKEITTHYKEKAPVLLHIKFDNITDDFIEIIKTAPIKFIFGLQSAEAIEKIKTKIPDSEILAFMPKKTDYPLFAQKGADIIRLWEHWLYEIDIKRVKEQTGCKVWVMSRDDKGSMNGSARSLTLLQQSSADGVLLNDITLGINWRNTALSK